MTVQSWSTTAGNNVLANTGINFDEGQSPSSVNDSVRQLMADVKTRFDADYTTTATAAGTTTLTSASTSIQVFTGTTTQTLVLPVASTLTTGRSWLVINNSTGAVTINSSGSNLVHTLQASGRAIVFCILASGTTAASWTVATLARTDASQTYTAALAQTIASGDATFTQTASTAANGSYHLFYANGAAIVIGQEGTTPAYGGSAGDFFVYVDGSIRFKISSAGVVTIAGLAGSGSRTVVASATGVLSAP